MNTVDALLEDLEVEMPDFAVHGLKMDELMDFDVHNFQDQYRKDNLLFALFSQLHKEANRRHKEFKDALDKLDSQLFMKYLTDYKMQKESGAATLATKSIDSDEDHCNQLMKVRAMEHKVGVLQGILDSLVRKGMALNIIAARDRVELQSGLR